jgi:hypothetical protein
MYGKEKTLGENYRETYEMWRERNTMTRNNMGAKLLLIKLKRILKAGRTTVDGIDGIKGKVRLRVWNGIEGTTKGMKCDKMDMNDKEGPRNNNTGLDKIENNKHQSSEVEQHTVR